MPFGDRSGPRGYGPQTGRGFGFCAGFHSPGYTKGPGMGRGYRRGPGFGGGFGGGFGRRSGRRFSYGWDDPYIEREPMYYGRAGPYAEPTKEEESSYLNRLVESLENELKAVKARLTEVTKKE